MLRLPGWLERYRLLPRSVMLFAAGNFCINLIHSAQFLLLNLFLKQRGLDDPTIAALTSQRFVAGLFLALPAGLWLRGRPLRRPMLLGSGLFPLTALAALEAARAGLMPLASGCFLGMGFAGLVLNVGSLPMMLRLAPKEQASEALSLQFAGWAAAAICAGLLATTLQAVGRVQLGPWQVVFDEHSTLLLLTLAGCAAPLLYARLPDPVPAGDGSRRRFHVTRADRMLLGRALLPTLCIATGAGLSIQFLNLFFSSVHQLDAARYSACGTASNVLVLLAGLVVPEVRRRLGWRGAILGVQTIAVALLVALGLTELWRAQPWALPLAAALFILRQPLMSMAGPATSELSMAYVGEHNRELVSACNGAIWSGAWWLAARIFEQLRTHHVAYWQIFLATAALYLLGTFAYLALIRSVEAAAVSAGADALGPPDGHGRADGV